MNDPDFNPYAAPKAEIPTFSGRRPSGSAEMWADGKILVLTKDAEFPDRCVKCDEPAEGYRLKRNLSWHPSGYYLLIFFCNILIYALVALIVRKKAKIAIGVCPTHRARRRNAIVVGWGAFLLTVGLIVASVKLEDLPEEARGALALVGALVFLVGLIYASIVSSVVRPTKIDDTFIYLKGTGPAFLAQLNSWPPVAS